MIVVSTGVPGVGATTVTEGFVEDSGGWKHLNYGDVMFETARDEGLVESRDEIRRLDPDQQKRIQRMAAKELAAEGRDGDVVVDTHCTIKTPRGYLCGLPEWVLKELEPDVVMLIEADPEEVRSRRQGDDSRARDVQSLDDIDQHQEVNRMAAVSYGALTGATVKIIQNHDGGLDEAVEEVVAVLEG